MTHEEQAIEYAMNKFHNLGVAVSTEGLSTALDYINEYYTKAYAQGTAETKAVMMLIPDEDMKHEAIALIQGSRPDIPAAVIDALLEAQAEVMEMMMVGRSEP